MIDVDIGKCLKARKGDQTAFYDLIYERRENLYRMAYAYVKDTDAALGIVHDTVYKAYVSVSKLKKPETFNAWLAKIAVNCSIDHLKKIKKIKDHEHLYNESSELENRPDESSPAYEPVVGLDLLNAIDKLDVNQKTVVILKYYQDFTITQISESTSWPVGTVKTHLHKALKALRLELEEGY